jgi:hypothetical protein
MFVRFVTVFENDIKMDLSHKLKSVHSSILKTEINMALYI